MELYEPVFVAVQSDVAVENVATGFAMNLQFRNIDNNFKIAVFDFIAVDFVYSPHSCHDVGIVAFGMDNNISALVEKVEIINVVLLFSYSV